MIMVLLDPSSPPPPSPFQIPIRGVDGSWTYQGEGCTLGKQVIETWLCTSH